MWPVSFDQGSPCRGAVGLGELDWTLERLQTEEDCWKSIILIQTGAINCSTIYAYTSIKTITSINFASDCFSGLGVIYWGHINILRQSPHAVWTKCTLSLTLWSWDWSGLWAWDWLTAFCSPVPAFACCMSATRRGREPRLWSPRSITCEFTEPMQPTLWTEPS